MSAATLPDLDGITEHYGIRLSYIGDEGDWIVALGHHNTRRMIAAVNRLYRRDIGRRALFIETGWDYEEAAERIHQGWCVLAKSCGMHDGDTNDPDCADCREIAAGRWWLRWDDVTADTLGAFPVTVLESA